MLVQFSVENFHSIREKIVLSMVATKRRSRAPGLDSGATFMGFEQLKLLKCAAIYGANASGKSNIVASLGFLKNFVLSSSKESQVDEPIGVDQFAFVSSASRGSAFEITFIRSGYLYQYGFEADSTRILSEYLKRKQAGAKRTSVLFERTAESISPGRSFHEGRGLDKKTRPNALFLSVCANFDGPISSEVIRWFKNLNVVSGLHDEGLIPYTIGCLENADRYSRLMELLGKFDLGFDRLEVRELSIDSNVVPDELKGLFAEIKKIQARNNSGNPKTLVTIHRALNADGTNREIQFDITKESEGTRKIVALAGPLLDTLDTGKVIVIDEFDARLHPSIARTILEVFNSEDSNPTNAQLVVASHDTNLLDNELLRRDQIWFVEKDRIGASHLTSLEEFKVRNDASFEKDYISGKYGAIPFIGNVRRLLGRRTHSKKAGPVQNGREKTWPASISKKEKAAQKISGN